MSFAFPHPKHMPCPDCGAAVPIDGREVAHVCDEDRRLDFQLLEHGEEIEGLEQALGEWLATPHGRFAAWLAEHRR